MNLNHFQQIKRDKAQEVIKLNLTKLDCLVRYKRRTIWQMHLLLDVHKSLRHKFLYKQRLNKQHVIMNLILFEQKVPILDTSAFNL